MKVKDLIQSLLKHPPNADVFHIWDGEARTGIELVWLSKSGKVMTADYSEVVYSDDARPIDAPTNEEDKNWMTTFNPKCDFCGSPNEEEGSCTNKECFNHWG